MGERPTVDLALVTVARTLDLPPGGATALFALGRTIGWIGHAIEQYEGGSLIRPRARYVGEQPFKAVGLDAGRSTVASSGRLAYTAGQPLLVAGASSHHVCSVQSPDDCLPYYRVPGEP
jgi:hypothetical protein